MESKVDWNYLLCAVCKSGLVDYRGILMLYYIDHHNPVETVKIKWKARKLKNIFGSFPFKVMQTPERNEKGVKLLYEYYHHLALVEKRMFTNKSFAGIQFVWFDSLTAHQTSSSSLAYEKANVLFNIGVLWTQIAAKKVKKMVQHYRES